MTPVQERTLLHDDPQSFQKSGQRILWPPHQDPCEGFFSMPRGRATPQAVERPATSKRSAFTLVELMVVVVILALLATLLVPSYVRWIRIAQRAKCQTQIKNLVAMTIQYATTNRNQRLPSLAADGDPEHAINPHWISRTWRDRMLEQYSISRDILYCPSNSGFNRDEHWNFTYQDKSYTMMGYCYFGANKYLSRLPDRPATLAYLDENVGNPAFRLNTRQSPAYEVIWADACISRGNNQSWIVANHLEGGDKPAGLVQGYLDGSVRWVECCDIKEIMTLAAGPADKATVFFGDTPGATPTPGPARRLEDIGPIASAGEDGYEEPWGEGGEPDETMSLFEQGVRSRVADVQLGAPISFYRQFGDAETVESVYRWDAGVRVVNIGDYERKIVAGKGWLVVTKGTEERADFTSIQIMNVDNYERVVPIPGDGWRLVRK